MNVRDALAAVGAVAVLGGVAVLVEPSLANLVGIRSDRALVTALALVAAVQGLFAVLARVRSEGRAADPPDAERRFRAAVPGDEFDRLLADLPDLRVKRRNEERAAVRERLEALAVEVLVARGLDEATARDHLEAGTWTADERASSFFVPAAERDLSVEARLRDAFGSDLAFSRRARRVVAAIAAHAEREVPPPGAGAREAPGASGDGPPGGRGTAGTTTNADRVDRAAADGGGGGE
ncbi:DUF7269 family protein [Haloglomus litoreum]|uniref:DUF7269 family protein n=1 Tax=Haloglomus litoreum TaxID=3034026 RepID=UPI0023E81A9B|nr:hypothetical protein [Haloglomus sp. DT116]